MIKHEYFIYNRVDKIFYKSLFLGIGVPILLAYVYGVVPISLCRSGGCGVSTSASGVRIEFDEENEIGMGNNPSAGNYG